MSAERLLANSSAYDEANAQKVVATAKSPRHPCGVARAALNELKSRAARPTCRSVSGPRISSALVLEDTRRSGAHSLGAWSTGL
jgi:cytidine deaminase